MELGAHSKAPLHRGAVSGRSPMTEGFFRALMARAACLRVGAAVLRLCELWLESVNKFTEFSRRPYAFRATCYPHTFLSACAAASQPQRGRCGDFEKGCFRFSGNSKQPFSTRAAPGCSRSHNSIGARGGPGEIVFFDFPRRLCAAFDARKRPPTMASRLP